jgi:uncharacterized protein YjbI with pentapeptide repeats
MNSIVLTSIIAVFLLLLGVCLALVPIFSELKSPHKRGDALKQKFREMLPDLSTELIGAAITTFLFGVLIAIVQQSETNNTLKQSLISRAASSNNAVAESAVRELNSYGWLQDGTLTNYNFVNANLQNASLLGANLSYSRFYEADLSGADLGGALLDGTSLRLVEMVRTFLGSASLKNAIIERCNLQEASLNNATLDGAVVSGSDFQLANLHSGSFNNTNLESSNFSYANLEFADLSGANLVDSIFQGAIFSQQTILPDGTNWSILTDITQFTDRNHPYFWRSSDPSSPAYQISWLPPPVTLVSPSS